MAQQTIGAGSVANDGTGDALRTAMQKVNANFTELYNWQGVHFIRQGADRTLASSTSAQAIFNTTTNGRLTLPTGLFLLRAQIHVDSMDTGTGNNANVDFKGSGTAVIGNTFHMSIGRDFAINGNAAASSSAGAYDATAFGVRFVLQATGAAMWGEWSGIFEVSTAGTLIPEITLEVAAAAAVKRNTWLMAHKLPDGGADFFGDWD